MKLIAIRNFLLNGSHVETGTALEIETGAAQRLLTARRAIIAPADEETAGQKKPKGGKK